MIHNCIGSKYLKIIATGTFLQSHWTFKVAHSTETDGNFTGVFTRAFIQRIAGRFLVREIALADWIANERGRETERGPMALRHWHSPTIVSRVFIGFRCVFVAALNARVSAFLCRVTVTCAHTHVSVTLFQISLVVRAVLFLFFS